MNTTMDAANQSRIRQGRWDLAKKWAAHIPAYVILGAWSFFTLFVIVWLILSSLKTDNELFKDVWALPTQIHLDNYAKALFAVDLGTYFVNSVVVVLISVLVILALSAPAAYILSRKQFK